MLSAIQPLLASSLLVVMCTKCILFLFNDSERDKQTMEDEKYFLKKKK